MKNIFKIALATTLCGVICSPLTFAQKKRKPDSEWKQQVIRNLDEETEKYEAVAMQIWNFSELGYQEEKSSALLQRQLSEQGFSVDAGVAAIPTAFVATYGSGEPTIGILAEFDALPGLSQQAVPEKKPAEGRHSGHGCGHHLYGTASVAAAVELKKLIEQRKLTGTVKVFGCPAEEGGSGKVYMVRAGLFDDVDAVIHWHPDSENKVTMVTALANKSAKFRFHGKSAHAAMAPAQGRSALDAVEAMNFMTNLMREHMPLEARVHYVITNGGEAPNVVPDFAEVYYYARHPDKEAVKELFERMVDAAEGAALGTGTTMDYEIIGGTHDLLLNKTLARVAQENLSLVGGVRYSEADIAFAQKIQETLIGDPPPIERVFGVETLSENSSSKGAGSTDVGDVSYTVPTVGFRAATWVAGTPAHSWQAVACGGTDIGIKGMIVAAKAMALTAIDLFRDPSIIQQANEEFKMSIGDYQYEALLGTREPALDYRNK